MSKKWEKIVKLEVLKASEGGPGYGIIVTLKAAGIPTRKAPSWCGSTSSLVGHVGIEVPAKFDKQACDIAFGK